MLFALISAPTTAESGDDLPRFLGKTLSDWGNWLLGTPLRIILIVVFALVILGISRRLIRTVSERIASGESDKSWLGSTEAAKALRNANPLSTARRAQRARTIGSVLRSSISITVGAIALLMIMTELGISIAPLLASVSVLGVALGFGAQSLVKDFLSGVFLILEDQYGVGDKVTIGDVNGTVESVALRVTKVRDADGTLWYLRNGEVLKVGNKTHGWANAAIEVRVAYDSDLEQVRSALETAAGNVKKDKKLGGAVQGKPTVVGIEAMSATYVSLRVVARTEPAKQWDVARALREQIRKELAAHSIVLAE